MIQPPGQTNTRWAQPNYASLMLPSSSQGYSDVQTAQTGLLLSPKNGTEFVSVKPVPFEQIPFNTEKPIIESKNRPLLVGRTSVPYAWIEEKNIVLPEKEPWTREGAIRYLGYANEIGAALVDVIGRRWFKVTNWVSGLYGVVDAFAASKLEYEETKNLPKKEQRKRVAKVAADATLFQVVASVLIPPIVIDGLKVKNFEIKGINRLLKSWVQKASQHENSWIMKLSPKARYWLPSIISIASIPLVAPIIDRSMDFVMNNTVRKLLKMPPTHHRLHFDELHTARFHQNPNRPQDAPPILLNSHA